MKFLAHSKVLLVIVGATVLSTLGIAASDSLNGISTRLFPTADSLSVTDCEKGSVLVAYGDHAVCMDLFEASPSAKCLFREPKSELETEVNIAESKCVPTIEEGLSPWRFVSYTEAAQLCARVGKRLPTNKEWYLAALGTTDVSRCTLQADLPILAIANDCSTAAGVYNLVGNVWEWVSDTVTDGKIFGRALPTSGYITLVDEAGVVLETGESPSGDFGGDYATVGEAGVFGILRGGFYGSKSDGGIFSQNLAAPLSLTAAGVGFRCVRDVW